MYIIILKLKATLVFTHHIYQWGATLKSSSSTPRLWRWPALHAYNPGRLFIRRIFSKPSLSTESPAFSQPCTTSWHAAAAVLNRRPLKVEDSLLLSYRERGRERAPFTKISELQIRVSLTPTSCLRGVLFKPTTCFWAWSLLEFVFIFFLKNLIPLCNRQRHTSESLSVVSDDMFLHNHDHGDCSLFWINSTYIFLLNNLGFRTVHSVRQIRMNGRLGKERKNKRVCTTHF